MDQNNISHIVTSFWWEGNTLKGYVEAANTETGKNFDGLVRQGCKVGFSLRAVGPITEKRGDTVTVKDPLTIFSYDWVIHPSHAAAYMDCIMSESTQPSIITNLRESFTPIFEPYYEDATKYLIESSKNLNIIAESMEVQMKEKTIGKDILVSEDAKSIYIRDGHDTIVVKPEEYLTKEITSYMSNLDLYGESKVIVDMNGNKVPLNEDDQIFNESLTPAFYNAVKSGDLTSVRIMMKDSLLVDPSFKQFEEMQKAASGLKGLFEPHDGSSFQPQNTWNDDYMNREMVKVVGNFSHERVNELKKIVRHQRPIDKVMSKVTASQPAQPTNQPTQVNVAKKGSSAMDKIRQFGSTHKKGLKVAGAIAGTAALAGGAYYLHKKHKERKEKEREEANKLESFNVFVFDESAYITESTMDFLLEACDYELSEDEILDNIENELIQEGFFDKFKAKRQAKEAERQAAAKRKSELCMKHRTDLSKERSRLVSIARHLINTEFSDLKKGALFDTSYDYPEDGELTVVSFDQFELIPNFRANYGKYSHKVYDRVANLKSKLNSQVSSDMFKVKIDDDGDWDDPYHIYVSLNISNINEDTELLDEDENGRREGESVEEYARRISGFTPQDQVKAEAKRAKQISKAADNAAGKGSTATAAVLGAGSAFAGKENKRNRRIAAGAILGTAALAGTAYAVNKALKKRKAKKAEDRDKESVSECMIDLILDEDYVYITEEDMDFLLEACDYELSESEILDNIENELNEEFKFKRGENSDKGSYKGDIDGKGILTSKNEFIKTKNGKIVVKSDETRTIGDTAERKISQEDLGKYMRSNAKRALASDLNSYGKKAPMKDQKAEKDAAKLAKHMKLTDKDKEAIIKRNHDWSDNPDDIDTLNKKSFDNADKIYNDHKNSKSTKTVDSQTNNTEQPKQVEVAKKGSNALENIKKFGSTHKKGLKIAGAIAGTAALAGGAYYLHKKHKEKKAKEREEANKSESFNVFVFDEEAYITESTMDMLLEACDYELSESEILDNIENELIQEGFFADRKAKKEAKAAKWAQERKMEQDEAKRLYNQFKSRIPNELKSHNMGMPEWSDENDSDIFNFEFSEEVQENHKEFDKLSEILYQFSKKIEKGTKFEVDTHGDDTVVSIRITGVPKINNESSELIQEGFFDKLKVNKGPSREEKAKAKAQLEEDKKVLTAEAKRLFPLVKTRLTPMLKKAKDDAGDNEFNYYNGLDQSSSKEAEVCICRFDYLPFKDDFGYDNEGYAAFEKMMDKAKTECERLAQFLNNKTEYNVSVELDTNCYYIMIKK